MAARQTQTGTGNIIEGARVLPSLTIDNAERAPGLADVLADAGIRAVEVSLASEAGMEALWRFGQRRPELIVGAADVTRPEHFRLARAAGARFATAVGSTPAMLAAAEKEALPFIAGVATPSEALALWGHGLAVQRYFPADRRVLGELATRMPDIRFLVAGWIEATDAADWLALPNVAAIAAGWVATADAIRAGDWTAIAAAAEAAREL